MRQSKAFTKLVAVVQAGITVPVEFRNFERAKYELDILANREFLGNLQEIEVSFEPGETEENGNWWITGTMSYISQNGIRIHKKYGTKFKTEELKDIPGLMQRARREFKEQEEEFGKWMQLIQITKGQCPRMDDSRTFKIGDPMTIVPNYCAREGVDNGD